MMKYDYYKAVKDDIRAYIEDNEIDINNIDSYEFESELMEVDSVTGNLSGSYTLSTWDAEENIAHNLDMFIDACAIFGVDSGREIEKGAESMDVLVRCSILYACICEILEDL